MDTKLLKQKILDLAIRGKLVPQDPNDEPASVLLERIRAEREQLIKQGKLKRSKSTSDNQHYQNVPFEIPARWAVARIDDVAFVTKLAGFEYTNFIANNLSSENGIPLFKGKNVQGGEIVYEFESYIPEDISDSLYRSQVTKKCLLTPYVGTLGNIGIHNKEGKFHLGSNVGKIELLNNNSINLLEEYVKIYLLSNIGYKELTKHKKATAQESISIEAIRDVFLLIPPLLEQHRIIKEVERWFDLIDELSANIQELQEVIKQTKSKVLNLAIHGKLVPQDPNDEPASELLKRISPHAVPCDTSHYENLPHNWSIARLESLCQSITSKKYQIKQSEIKEKGKYPVISQSTNYIEGYSDLTDKVYSLSSPLVIFGDHTRIVKYVDFNFIVGADGVKILQPLIFPKYFYFLTEYSSTQIENRGYGRHYSYLSQYEVPIPPIEEQEKIVSKLEEIFETIDKIIAEL